MYVFMCVIADRDISTYFRKSVRLFIFLFLFPCIQNSNNEHYCNFEDKYKSICLLMSICNSKALSTAYSTSVITISFA